MLKPSHNLLSRQRCGHDAALGRRSRVAHMPTATTTATDALRGVIEEGGAGPASNQHRRSGGPTDWVQFTVASGLDPRSALGPTSSLHSAMPCLFDRPDLLPLHSRG